MKKRVVELRLPLSVTLPRKTKKDRKAIINMNNYRNWNFMLSNQAKHVYKDVMASQLVGLKITPPIELHFILHKGSKRMSDRANVLAIHEKFLCDAMVEYGCIEDDNDEFILGTRYSSGEINKEDPHVKVIIKEV